MGKYMRKCRGAAGAEVAAVEVVGVRTRSRAASATAPAPVAGGVAKVSASRRRKALVPAAEAAGEEPAAAAVGTGGSCYLKLRSRMLFKAPPSPAPRPAEAGPRGAVLAAVLSRCSSTASSVDAYAQERSAACRSDAAEAGGDHVPEVSAGSNSRNGGCHDRDRREMTPSSRAHGELSDLESDLAGRNDGRSSPAATSSLRPRTIPAEEIEEFFAAAEEAEAQRFASKYNFDVARGVPLDAGGRFEWAPVVSI